MKKILLLSLLMSSLFACKADLTKEYALKQLLALPEFSAPFYAPFHTGKEILNGDDHKNPAKYINEHLGNLIKEGLVEAKIVETNSWRSVMNLELTSAGMAMTDTKRNTEKHVYVKSCKVTPTEITTIEEIVPEKEFKIEFLFTESEVTPFGVHLGFENGRAHKDSRIFVRMGWGWEIK